MRSVTRNVEKGHQKQFSKLFDSLCGRYTRWEVWSDWVTMAAIAISNAVDKVHAEEREKTYMNIVSKYKPKEVQVFAEMFALIVEGIGENPDQDFLGELYMVLELGNKHAGQFFTPYSVCRMTAAVTIDETQAKIDDQGFVSVSDPACGAGALLVAFANECRKYDINYQTSVLFVGQDIDYIVGMMCYIQLSLLGCAGYVFIGNTFTNPATAYDRRGLIPYDKGNVWYTPFYFREVWHWRRIAAQMDMMFSAPIAKKANESPSKPTETADNKIPAQPKKRARKAVATPVMPTEEPKAEQENVFSETKTGQLTFF